MYTCSICKNKQTNKQRIPTVIYKKEPQNPIYAQLRLSKKSIIGKFPKSN